ncbi:MAG: WbqC family protein [Candidatus Omnitrophica bacterium]|nr:WbqC family protein [Candidatus Omnitrophota bacterium]
MVLAGHQPNYLPWLGFFDKAAQADHFVLVDTVQFVKRGPFGFQHRAKIKTASGAVWLTVPVLTKGKFDQTIQETRINNAAPWRRKHWRAIELNYHQAPFFARYAGALEAFYACEWDRLALLNEALIRWLFDVLGLHLPVTTASGMGITGVKTELILKLCQAVGADTYLHGKHGREYADIAQMERAGVRSLFQDYQHPAYPQQFGAFTPQLSVIDLLFNHGPESLAMLRGNRRAEPSS